MNLRFTHHSLNTSAMAKPHICSVLCSGTTALSQDMVSENNICLGRTTFLFRQFWLLFWSASSALISLCQVMMLSCAQDWGTPTWKVAPVPSWQVSGTQESIQAGSFHMAWHTMLRSPCDLFVNGICMNVLHGSIAAIANACYPCQQVASVMTVLSACTYMAFCFSNLFENFIPV